LKAVEKTIYFEEDAVVILDQTKLPGQVVFEKIETIDQAAEAIKKLKVRGAPLIGVAAAFALAMAVKKYSGPEQVLEANFRDWKNTLASTRPTAVNLFWALERMERVYRENRKKPLAELGNTLKAEAEAMYQEDIEANKALGDFGQELLKPGSTVLTICNAGALATCGHGTALGVIRSAAQRGKIGRVYACETRPLLQGARLTVWELIQDKIPVTLITDNMAGHTIKTKKIDAVIAGADCIAANGDTANKIGTSTLAVLADYYDIPFYIAAPMSTINTELLSGDSIPIEERDPDEVRQIRGSFVTVPQVEVFSPAFDVTSHELIDAIITEKGVFRPPYAF
jgi:methylthioribose-1-phosphate isomerase